MVLLTLIICDNNYLDTTTWLTELQEHISTNFHQVTIIDGSNFSR